MRLLICVFALSLMMAPLEASVRQSSKPSVVSEEPPKAQPPSDYKVPLLTDGLKLSDFVDMAPGPSLKDQLQEISGFIQNTPSDGQPATEKTEVWLGHTKAALYMVFVCHDHRPGGIRGHLARRENILQDDTVSVLLDPFQDRRKGVLFSVNAAGVQADAAWTENSNPDYSYDQVWDSEGRITKDGWIALVVIPFRSLRFRPTGPDWGVVFSRNLPRNSEVDYWPRVAANVSGVLSQEGTLRGIEGVTGSRNIQLNPYVLGQNVHTVQSLDPFDPYFSTRNVEGTAGGEIKAILKDSIVFDGTINPDFSTVESDQPQFTVNQRYPVYFPELRPFFLENANYFATPLTLLYTRNIVHPEFGARATGKIGHYNIGLLGIDDRTPGETVEAGDALYKKRALFAVGRVSRDIGKGSSIGAIYTDEEFAGGWNRIGGFDFTARMTDKWTALGQFVESSTKGNADSGVPLTYSAGPASYFEAQRSGHSFNLDSVYNDYSTGFVSQVGFIQTADLRSNHTHSTYQWYPKKSVIQSIGLEGNENLAFDHQGNRVYRYLQFDPFFLLPRNMVIAPIGIINSDTVGPQDGTLLGQNRNFAENGGGLVLRGAPLTQLNLNIQAFRNGNVNYNPVAGGIPSTMDEQTLQALVTIQPFRQLTMDNTYLFDRDHSVADHALVFENQVIRTKINYQFTRAFSARVIVEYDSLLANPVETSLLRTKEIGTQALLTWLPHPGTAIYVGYNNDIQNLDRALCDRELDGVCNPDATVPPRSPKYLDDGRQIFVKASYLFRF